MRILLTILALLASLAACQAAGNYLIGSGVYDVTGESAEAGFMGYAALNQKGTGIHFRLRARAFIVVDKQSSSRVAYVSLDLCFGMEMMKTFVIEQLQAKYGNLYVRENVIISGTHTHSGPGGIGGTALVDITTLGFIKANFDAAVTGIVNAIGAAHASLRSGSVQINTGSLDGANINRSPVAYLRDPAAERAKYKYDTDHLNTVLKFTADDGRAVGMVDIFAVHATSMNNTNTLVSGDNKGYASLLFEKAMNPPGTLPGKGAFVAAFGQSNEGDVSPNTRGPRCPDGSECDFVSSTCGGLTQGCIASGPGRDMFESTEIIGRKQFEAAMQLFATANKNLSGPVDYRHTYVDMHQTIVNASYTHSGQDEKLCEAALGYSFAAGTTDGPGEFDFTQSTNSSNPFWDFVASFLAKPTPEQIACQRPKPILLDVGLTKPLPWVSYILPMQLVRVGQFWMAAVPGEFSTMAGRRLRDTITASLQRAGAWSADSVVVIAGLSNSYSHYITTFEEYQQQRYEGASTLYGPHTLAAFQQTYDQLAQAMAKGQKVPAGPSPVDMRNNTFNFRSDPPADTAPQGKNFGDVAVDVTGPQRRGATATASWWGASPRNDLMTQKTFITVERFDPASNSWVVVCDDGCWETKFHWKRVETSQSLVTAEWEIPVDTPLGTYRFQTFGVWKDAIKNPHPFSGTSSSFQVVN